MSEEKKETAVQSKENAESTAPDAGWRRWLPVVVCGLFTLMILSGLRAPKAKSDYDYVAFGKLPVLLGGRVKPMDSVARNALLKIAGQQKVPVEGNGPDGTWGDLVELHDEYQGQGLYHRKFYQFNKHPKKLDPSEWLLEVLLRPEVADRRFIFRIDLPELLDELKFETTGVDQSGLRYYSFEQLKPYVMRLHKQSRDISGVKEELRSPYQRAVYKLAAAVHLYVQLRNSYLPNPLLLPDAEPSPSQGARAKQEWDTTQAMKKASFVYSQAATKDFLAELKRLGQGTALQAELMGNHLSALQTIEGIVRQGTFNPDPELLGKNLFQTDAKTLVEMNSLIIGQFENIKDIAEANRDALRTRLDDIGITGADRDQITAQLDNLQSILNALNLIAAAPKAEQEDLARNLTMDRLIYRTMADRGLLLVVPPSKPNEKHEGWKKSGESLEGVMEQRKPASEQVTLLAIIATQYRAQDSVGFNQAVADYTKWLEKNKFTKALGKGKAEHSFNSFAPFASSMRVYLVAVLLAGFSWLKLSVWLTRSAFYLIGLAFVVHTAGLIFRMYLEGRPPVTNLYSSAVFCGWGAVLLGWILERIYRNGIGSFTAGIIGYSTLIIANHLAQEGDTMQMMQAVLDTNFWLATHVTIITIGYSATFLAGFLAIIYVIRGVFTSNLNKETASGIARMIYGIVCFSALFSFVGTVLGGIWADQSWGRFWGWDTKENGALLIVLWNVLVLHAKLGGIVKERGLITLVIFGNVITAWSWFGTNMLGIGLHAYGFMDEAFKTLMWFAIGQVLFMLAAAQPIRNWQSGAQLSKEHNSPIAKVVSVMMGLGVLLHLGSLWTSGFLSHLGIALVGAGMLLSFLPAEYTASSSRKSA
jgi:ABC-type transport system involved in cytochrome c biogenesis permease subunit